MQDKTIIGRIAHGRMQDAVDEQRARFLVELIFDGLAAHRHLNDDIQAVGWIVSDRDQFDIHFKQIRSEEHTSELQSLMRISYAVFCLKKKKKNNKTQQATK